MDGSGYIVGMPEERVELNATVLVVDDLAANRDVLRQTLESTGYEVLLASDGETGLRAAAAAQPDVILLDVMMPGLNGFETCQRLKNEPATAKIPVIFISAQNETQAMVRGLRSGGVDYITKPFQSEEVLARVETHLTNYQLTREIVRKNEALEESNARLKKEMERRERAETSLDLAGAQLTLITDQESERWGLESFIGKSPAMRQVISDIRRLQDTDTASVLIRGESGTGKELVARALHYSGRRSKGPFIAVNCAAIPGELAESLFFGHLKGSFSGATSDRKGYFEMAHAGTLFLDEVGDMPLALQAKLLRVLDDGRCTPVGGSKDRQTNVRVIAATNADLARKISEGSFRNDLYYRIGGYEIQLRPLRERVEDVELLTQHFLNRFATELGRPAPSLTSEAKASLFGYRFPGNIRELKSILERAVIDSAGEAIRENHLRLEKVSTESESSGFAASSAASRQDEASAIPLNLDAAEVYLAKRALAESKGNMSLAARRLGINRTKMYRILSRVDEESD